MYYYFYRQCRDAAWRILRDYGVSEMPVPVISLCNRMGIITKYYNDNDGNDGKTLYIDNIPYILVKEHLTPEEKRFVIAHEVGHIILEHINDDGNVLYHSHVVKKSPLEDEATGFALRLLAPACVLWGCAVNSSREISEICSIPFTYSDKRMRRMKVLYKKEKFFTAPIEQEVYTNFIGFIEKYNNDKK